jgi:hypothetical protein
MTKRVQVLVDKIALQLCLLVHGTERGRRARGLLVSSVVWTAASLELAGEPPTLQLRRFAARRDFSA